MLVKTANELSLKHPDINTDINDFDSQAVDAIPLHDDLKENNSTVIALFKKYKKVPKALKWLKYKKTIYTHVSRLCVFIYKYLYMFLLLFYII